MGAGAPVLWGGSLPAGMTGPELLREILDEGANAGFNVFRVLAHGVSKETALQTSPGQYSEAAFKVRKDGGEEDGREAEEAERG
jgi:hypothetical protein